VRLSERAPRPDSASERRLVGRFADAVQSGDLDEIVSLLTDDALSTCSDERLIAYGGGRFAVRLVLVVRELRGGHLTFDSRFTSTR
jgi:ketosteroid isomerase-like protein